MASSKGHIMLSYQWDNQKEVKRIKEALEAQGYPVWMDVDKMHGDIFKSMATGVESSSLVIICMSPKYQESENCNRELEYAKVKNKKILPIKMTSFEPSGSLGLIIAGALYVDFSNPKQFSESMQQLCKQVSGHIGKQKSAKDNQDGGKIDPVAIVRNANGHVARLGKTGKYYCGKKLDGPPCKCCDGTCGPSSGCNCSACMKLDVESRRLPRGCLVNRVGSPSRKGETKLFYCGKRVMENVKGCDGYCGPTNGPNCGPCKILQDQATGRYRTLVA